MNNVIPIDRAIGRQFGNNTRRRKMYRPVYQASLIIFSLFISFHNIFVLALYWKERVLKRSTTNFLLVNLACCDLMYGMLLLPILYAITTAAGTGDFVLFFVGNVVTDLTIVVTVASLSSVVLERYIQLCHPFRYSDIVNKRRMKFVVALVWLLSILLAVLPVTWSVEALTRRPKVNLTAHQRKAYQIHSIVILIMFFMIPTVLLSFCLFSMFCTMQRLNKTDFTVGNEERKKREQRVALIFLSMYVCLVVCWMPLIIIRLLVDFQVPIPVLPRWANELFVILCAIPPSANPFIYVWCKSDFRKCALKLLPVRIFFRQRNQTILQTAMIPLNPAGAMTSAV